MALVEFELDEHVAVVTLNSGENRLNLPFFDALLQVLDRVEKETDAKTMVVKSSHEKIFSNGIDLDWLVPIVEKGDVVTTKKFFYQLNDVLKRIMNYPLLTIAAVTGHAFAGGAILACAFDFRFMRSDRGFLCLPEVDLGIPILPGTNALLAKAIPMYKLEEMQYTGKRLTAEECVEHHIVMKACHIDDLMDETMSFAKSLKKERMIVHEMKQRLNKPIVQTMEVEDIAYIEAAELVI